MKTDVSLKDKKIHSCGDHLEKIKGFTWSSPLITPLLITFPA